MDEKGTPDTIGMDDAAQVADQPDKTVTYDGRENRECQTTCCIDGSFLKEKLKIAQERITEKIKTGQRQTRKQEQQL